MARHDVYSCSNCSTVHRQNLVVMHLLVCTKCGQTIQEIPSASRVPHSANMPDDWSFIQIGTTGEFKKNSFQVVGRIRLQLRNEYKNFWCAADLSGSVIWIVESFGSISVFTSPAQKCTEKVSALRAGNPIKINQTLVVTGEFVDKCESRSIRGEIGLIDFFEASFFIIQAGRSIYTAYFFPRESGDTLMLLGEKASIESLNLKNTVVWNEWK